MSNSDAVTACDFLIIGSGPAGQKAAIQGAKEGKNVILVERESRLGGICVNRGTIPSKALRESAINATRMEDDAIELLPLMSQVDSIVAAHDTFSRAQLERNHVRVETGMARFLAPDLVEVRTLRGDRLRLRPTSTFVATGSAPRHPPQIDIDHERVFDSDSILALAYVPSSIIVLGGGVIACEYASIFARLGSRVTVVDRQDLPLGFLDHEISTRFCQLLAQAGADFVGNAEISAVRASITGVEVELHDATRLHAEKLLVAQGRVASVASLNLEAAGLEVDERGLLATDGVCRTAVPGIYAIGDVQGPPSLASAAMSQGRRAARHALGLPEDKLRRLVPTGIYSIPEIACVGMTEFEARSAGAGVRIGYGDFNEVARSQIRGAGTGMLKLVTDGEGQRILGVHVIGEGATELVHIGQMAMAGDLCADEFVHQVFNFPTMAEAYRTAALQVLDDAQSGQGFWPLVTGNGARTGRMPAE